MIMVGLDRPSYNEGCGLKKEVACVLFFFLGGGEEVKKRKGLRM